MSLADTLRAALETGHRASPELIGGDVLDEDALAHGVTPPQCWSPWWTGPSRP